MCMCEGGCIKVNTLINIIYGTKCEVPLIGVVVNANLQKVGVVRHTWRAHNSQGLDPVGVV